MINGAIETMYTEERYDKLCDKSDNCVYLIDDDIEIRRSTQFVLATSGIVSWPFASSADFLDNLHHLNPAPILINMRLPHISGIELMEIISARGIGWPIIAMATHADIPTAVRAIRMGAIEFLEKPFDFNLLSDSMQLAFDLLNQIKQAEDVKRKAQRLFGTLSPREVEVIGALIRGSSNKTAAFYLALSVRTIEMHRANAIVKLKAKNIVEVVQLAKEAEIDFSVRGDCILPALNMLVAETALSNAHII